MEEQVQKKKEEQASAGWIMTFADLMSLLMCFFVLLLSFAELDLNKFKAIAGSMRLAFGVQREIKADAIPKGTSIIAQEFSPGKPEPTPINEIRQITREDDKQTLDFTDALVQEKDANSEQDVEEQTKIDAARLLEALREEVEAGMIQVETTDRSVIIRIREKGSFASGVAKFAPGFMPVIEKLREALTYIAGRIVVAGHTDDVPIRTARYRSNWDLSAARAVSVVHELLQESELDPRRLVVEGHGEAHPLASNDTPENRALNRRVEIIIHQDPGPLAESDENAAGITPIPELGEGPMPGATIIEDVPAPTTELH